MAIPKAVPLDPDDTPVYDKPVFAIIGGGMAGVIQAIHLAEHHPWLHIHLFERKRYILSSTSSMNPGRPAFGFHYAHLPTALFCQANTVRFAKFLDSIGCPSIFAPAPQNGIYVLMKRPLTILDESVHPIFSSDDVEPVFEQIRAHAIERYSHDDGFHRLFGRPQDMCRRMKPGEYEHLLTPQVVESMGACYETTEKTFDTVGICAFLREYIRRYPNMTVFTRADVRRLDQIAGSKGGGYRISWVDKGGETRHETAQLLTLACWERVGFFRRQLGRAEAHPTHNRLKMLAVVEVEVTPEKLETIRPIFVASGAFGMMAPQRWLASQGRIVCQCAVTLAVKTNCMTVGDDVPLPRYYEAMLDDGLGDEKMGMAGAILEGARGLFSCLETARLVDIRFGTVRVPFGPSGNVDIHDPASDHHARAYSGCKSLGEGLYVNEAMKLSYSLYNAEQITDWARCGIDRLRQTGHTA